MINKRSLKNKIKKQNKNKTTKIIKNKNKKNNNIINKDKIFHFFDDHIGWMKGITFDKDEKKIESIMCTNNIVCHKVPNPNGDAITNKKYKYLLKSYISRISNKNMRNYIRYEIEMDKYCSLNNKDECYIKFDTECGLTDDQMFFFIKS